MYIQRNKKININMITMGMAVMVENEDAFWLSYWVLITLINIKQYAVK